MRKIARSENDGNSPALESSNQPTSNIPQNDERTIRRVTHSKDYVSISNSTVQDKRLSWEARGLLAYLLSLPENWQIKVGHLQQQGNAGRDGVRRMLRELQTFGYASGFGKSEAHTNSGRFGTPEITIYESPADNPFFNPAESPTPEKPSPVSPTPESPSPVQASLYKEQIKQRTDQTKNTHTHLRAIEVPARQRYEPESAEAKPVCVSPNLTLQDYRDFARSQPESFTKPDAWASTHFDRRDRDEIVGEWKLKQSPDQIMSARSASPGNKMFFTEAVQRVRSISTAHARDPQTVIAELDVDDDVRCRLVKHFSTPVNSGDVLATAAGMK